MSMETWQIYDLNIVFNSIYYQSGMKNVGLKSTNSNAFTAHLHLVTKSVPLTRLTTYTSLNSPKG